MALSVMKMGDTQSSPRMNAMDSLNVNIGVLSNYTSKLRNKIQSKSFSKEDSDEKKHEAAMELMNSMASAKKNKLSFANVKDRLSPMAKIMHENLIEKVSNESIANNKHKEYQKIGEGINLPD